jgi:hypothetical protein
MINFNLLKGDFRPFYILESSRNIIIKNIIKLSNKSFSKFINFCIKDHFYNNF